VIRPIFYFILILTLISCKPVAVTDDYYGQPHPDTVPVVFAPDVISVKGRLEHGISFTPDTKEMAFGVLHKDYSGHIQYAKKIANTWTAPSLFEPLASEMVFLPYFTPDGKNLLYAQGNSVTNDSYRTNLYALEKVNGAWKKPTKLKLQYIQKAVRLTLV